MKPVRKAVFPVAGLGTRFLPATKSIPKEMLPIVDKPLIQYAVEEALAAGIETLIFVTSRKKHAISDHFDRAFELETKLAANGKDDLLECITNIIPTNVIRADVTQLETLGLGHAVNCARGLIGDEPFAVLLADDLIKSDGPGCLQQLISQYEKSGRSTIAVQNIATEDSDQYGMIEPSSIGREVLSIIEKPKPADAPSNLAVVGRYILTPEIFPLFEQVGAGAGGEIQLTDAIALLMQQQSIEYCEFTGRRYDCGSKAGFIEATVDYALERPELRDKILLHIRDSLNR
ncbi:MAG: UTP--glucose-1-phosphate uridylyltransferase GalU [Proteobacteria bacterium]|nr:UTP--glucose-1-phosphate uridylyltransferase GalU [Pseudomonadota bacterium]